ncbi:hypothetical protein [Enterobacter sp.]|nr:hypothetical protein [Enterobacter sp.]
MTGADRYLSGDIWRSSVIYKRRQAGADGLAIIDESAPSILKKEASSL